MVYALKKTSQFKESLKLAKKRGLDILLLEEVVEKLRTDQPLEEKYHNHELKGTFKGIWECHIQPDWLLLYLKDSEVLVLTLVNTGTHSDIFKK
ncbi:type II toxin-antitoxin system YafQ family toxin [Treponema pectinovorum]|uniref:type II toxin-antitoxin system YafQ family toxin n=1 Tax=Treponema pectinovorum TaxID=164 RepID=UPI003D8E4E65